jgi:hypothetical protein
MMLGGAAPFPTLLLAGTAISAESYMCASSSYRFATAGNGCFTLFGSGMGGGSVSSVSLSLSETYTSFRLLNCLVGCFAFFSSDGFG